MKITHEPIREEFTRDTHWTRINFTSDSGSRKSVVVTCASHEYLWEKFRTKDYSKDQKNQWLNQVISKWKKLGDDIFTKEVHFDVYATSQEGLENGMEFLTKEIVA